MITSINEFGLPNLVVPAEVFFNDDIGCIEKFLFSIINNLVSNENGFCWAGNAYLAKLMNIKKNTISIAISKLQENDYIVTEYSKRMSDGATLRKIYINHKYQEIYAETLRKKHKELNNFLREENKIEKPGAKKEAERISQESNTHLTGINHPPGGPLTHINRVTHTHQHNIDSELDNENQRFSIRTSNEDTSGTRSRTRKRKNKNHSNGNSNNISMKEKVNGKKKNKEHTAQSSNPKYNSKANLDLVEIWNKQSNLRSHKNQNSKTFRDALKKLDMLRKGTLHKQINKNHLQDSIPKSLLSTKWKKSDIAKAIKNLNEWCKEGNLPYKKDWIKKLSLADAIFCAQYGSPLIDAYTKGITTINDPIKKLSSEQEKEAYARFEQFFLSRNGSNFPMSKKQQIVDLVQSLKGLRENHELNWKQRDPSDFGYGYTPCNLKALVIDYLEFLNGSYSSTDFVPNESLTPGGLKIGNYVWYKFEQAYKEKFGVDPISGS